LNRLVLTIAALVCLAGVATGTGARQTATSPAGLPHVRIDVEARAVAVDCRVVLTRGPIELLLCLTGAKEHESILATDARPAHVHGALLALGLSPGRPGRWVASPDGDDRYLPPAGATLKITLQYAEPNGRRRRVQAPAWIRPVQPESGDTPLEWVFVGSSAAAGPRYPADRSGEIISVANFPRAVVDVPFASTTADAMLSFAANEAAIPPVGTPVTVVLSPEPGADRAPVARATFGIDRFGLYTLDGLSIDPDQIIPWAERFLTQHARPYIVVHAAPRALAFDLQRLGGLLSAAGIDNVDIRTSAPAGEILPRTGRQAAGRIQRWRRRLAPSQSGVAVAVEDAETVLRQIEHRREELAALLALWADYRRQLALSLATRHQPAPDKEPAP